MFLDIGNIERVDEPSADQIVDRLRNLPATAPFADLNADEELFIQATPAAAGYRVELRQGTEHRFAILPLGQVEVLFKAFREWDERVIESVAWQRLSIRNDPYRRLIFVAAGIIALAIVRLWLGWR